MITITVRNVQNGEVTLIPLDTIEKVSSKEQAL